MSPCYGPLLAAGFQSFVLLGRSWLVLEFAKAVCGRGAERTLSPES